MSQGHHLAYRSGQPLSVVADYVVVGTGAGGSMAALILARAGYQVAMVEAGPWREAKDYPETMLGVMRDVFPDWGANVAVGNSILPIVQGRLVGGGTVINSAIMVRTPDDVLVEWQRDHGLGDLFSHDAVGRVQDEIERELSVEDSKVDAGAHFGRSSQMLLEALQGREMEAHPMRRNVKGCQGSARCLQGCRHGAKQSTQLNWIPEVLERGGTVLSCAPVSRVELKSGRAVGVIGRFVHPQTRVKGAHFAVEARRGVILAASATGTGPLLEASGVRSPALGQYWRAHPGAGVIGVYPDVVDMYKGATQGTASIHHRKDLGLKLESLTLPLELVAGRTGGAGRQLTGRLADIRHQAMWISAVRAEAVGRVKRGLFGAPSVYYRPTQRDLERLRKGVSLLARAHFDQGARSVRPGVVGLPFELGPDQLHLLQQAPLHNRAWTWVLSHLFGGAVIGDDPRRAVVGTDLQVYGVRDLHVVCAAALPTTLGVNPQHTIMAVAWLMAERLANQDRSGYT
ncbi:MAG TPA: hypothetical protein DCQ06_04445 [Myxococcales bacterium]|nr:hypothetical protein [Myxococcales bacterium]HAN30826.1 hypothetical protein [Myxococcales bacterium]